MVDCDLLVKDNFYSLDCTSANGFTIFFVLLDLNSRILFVKCRPPPIGFMGAVHKNLQYLEVLNNG